GQICGRMPRHMHHGCRHASNLESVVVVEQMIELRAVGAQFVFQIEDVCEGFLNLGDAFADCDSATHLVTDVACGGKMVGMGMRFQQPRHLQLLPLDEVYDLVGRLGSDTARLWVVVQYGIDHGACRVLGVVDHVGKSGGLFIEEGFNLGRCHNGSLSMAGSSASLSLMLHAVLA